MIKVTVLAGERPNSGPDPKRKGRMYKEAPLHVHILNIKIQWEFKRINFLEGKGRQKKKRGAVGPTNERRRREGFLLVTLIQREEQILHSLELLPSKTLKIN